MLLIFSFLKAHLSRREKLMLSPVVLASVLSTIVEAVTLGALLPILIIIAGEGSASEGYVAYIPDWVYSWLNSLTVANLAVLIVLLFISKSVILMLITKIQYKYLYGIKHRISTLLFSKYIQCDYRTFILTNSTQMTRNLQSEIYLLLSGVFVPIMHLVTEVMMVLAVMIIFLYLNFWGTITIAALALIVVYIYQRGMSKWLVKLGEDRQWLEGQRLKIMQDSFYSLKEIAVYGAAKYFIRKYESASATSTHIETIQATLSRIPLLFLELVIIIIACSYWAIETYIRPSEIVSMGVVLFYLAAVFRLLPSVQRVLVSLQSLKSSQAVLRLFNNELIKPLYAPQINVTAAEAHVGLSIQGVSYRHNGVEKDTLLDINLEISPGQIVAIQGPSGSGKTTLLNLMLGLLAPSSGRITFNGVNIFSDLEEWRKNIGYVGQSSIILDEALKNNIAFGISDIDIDLDAVNNASQSAKLSELIHRLPQGVDSAVGERGALLSGGEAQRLAVARAIYRNPRLLILDEPTSALDARTSEQLIEQLVKLKQQMIMIIIVTHDLKLLELIAPDHTLHLKGVN